MCVMAAHKPDPDPETLTRLAHELAKRTGLQRACEVLGLARATVYRRAPLGVQREDDVSAEYRIRSGPGRVGGWRGGP